MIVSFSVQNFRSIREKLTLDFRATADKHQEEYFIVNIPKPKMRILKMAMIYGANASGKTSILMALDYLSKLIIKPIQDKNTRLNIPSFALDRDKPSTFEIEYYYLDTLYEYKLTLDTKQVHFESLHYYPKGKRSEVFVRQLTDKDIPQYRWSEKLLKKRVKELLELTIDNRTILSSIASINNENPIQKANEWFRFKLMTLTMPYDNLMNVPNQIFVNYKESRNEIKGFLISTLKRADLWIDDIEITETEVEASDVPEQFRQERIRTAPPKLKPTFLRYDFGFIHRIHDKQFTLDMSEESLGTQRFYGLGFLLMMLIEHGMIVPIDEIDSSLHNDLLIHFITMFLKHSTQGQLIFTSHNTALLNEKEIIRRDCIWITDRKTDGSTELTSVSDYPVRKEHAIDSLFKKGLIGGKPNLGSITLEDFDGQLEKAKD